MHTTATTPFPDSAIILTYDNSKTASPSLIQDAETSVTYTYATTLVENQKYYVTVTAKDNVDNISYGI